MNTGYSLLLVLVTLCNGLALADDSTPDGGQLFLQYCGSCHGQSGAESNRVAPPVVAIKAHYLRKRANKQEFVNAIVNWVPEPSNENALMPGAIRRFGLMPALPLSEQDLTAIAEFIYDEKFDKPDWYQKHYKSEHGGEK